MGSGGINMRIWDIEPSQMCSQHLLGEHRELHGCWNIIFYGKKGYSNHPETKRWVGKLPALKKRHDLLAEEMNRRSGNPHKTMLPTGTTGIDIQTTYINTIPQQVQLLKTKGCTCCGNNKSII